MQYFLNKLIFWRLVTVNCQGLINHKTIHDAIYFLCNKNYNIYIYRLKYLLLINNLIKIQLFIILSYGPLRAAHKKSCADDILSFLLLINSQLTSCLGGFVGRAPASSVEGRGFEHFQVKDWKICTRCSPG